MDKVQAQMECSPPLLAELERDLHDLCQPLTTLQCRLELAEMSGDMASLRDAVTNALGDTVRLFEGIAAMRTKLESSIHKEK